MSKAISFVEKYTPWLLETVDDKKKSTLTPQEREEIEKKSVDKDPVIRRGVAESESSPADILSNLAIDKDVTVRRAVAGNKATPSSANIILAQDEDEDVRLILARRLVQLLPDLSEDEQAEIYASTVQVLHILAEDKVTNIRVALSSSLKDVAKTPPDLARKLAADIEREVSEPILRFSVSLSDEDLMAIIAMNPMSWKVSSIAERKNVSADVSDAVLETGNIEAGEKLLNNKQAKIHSETLRNILQKAQEIPSWHQASIKKQRLPGRVSHMLNNLIGGTLNDFLSIKTPMDNKTRQDVINTAARRIDWIENTDRDESSAMRVRRLASEGKLTEDIISDALAWHDHEFVIHALGYKIGVSPVVIRRVLDTQSAKATLALCKRANLSMQSAIKIEQQIAKVPTSKMLYAKGGKDYPITEDEVKWQLEFFGIE